MVRTLLLAAVLFAFSVFGGLETGSAATWNVWIDPRLPRERVWMTLNSWSEVADVQWVESKAEGALIIQLGPIDAPADLQYSGLYVRETNTITLANPDPYRVSQVLMHEVGHFLGLHIGPTVQPHCPDPRCIMWFQENNNPTVCSRCVADVIGRFGEARQRAKDRRLSFRSHGSLRALASVPSRLRGRAAALAR